MQLIGWGQTFSAGTKQSTFSLCCYIYTILVFNFVPLCMTGGAALVYKTMWARLGRTKCHWPCKWAVVSNTVKLMVADVLQQLVPINSLTVLKIIIQNSSVSD